MVPDFAEPFFGISVIAPIARDVADTALAFEVMAGPDPRDSDSVAVASDSSWHAGSSHRIFANAGTRHSIENGDRRTLAGRRRNISAKVDYRLRRVIRSGRLTRRRKRDATAALPDLPPCTARISSRTRDSSIRTSPTDRTWSFLAGVDVAAALGASSAIKDAFAAFFGEVDILLAPTVSLCRLAPGTTRP